jgi:hypothetical protein
VEPVHLHGDDYDYDGGGAEADRARGADDEVPWQSPWTNTSKAREKTGVVQEKPRWYKRAAHHVVKGIALGFVDT